MGDLDSIIQIIDDRIDNSDFGAEEEIEEVLQALSQFLEVVEHSKSTFIAHLDEDTYINIHYVGWNGKDVKSYRIQIWVDECGCTYDEIKRFGTMNDAILYSVEKTK